MDISLILLCVQLYTTQVLKEDVKITNGESLYEYISRTRFEGNNRPNTYNVYRKISTIIEDACKYAGISYGDDNQIFSSLFRNGNSAVKFFKKTEIMSDAQYRYEFPK